MIKPYTLQFQSQLLEQEYFKDQVTRTAFRRKILLFVNVVLAIGYIIDALVQAQITYALILFCSLFALSCCTYTIIWLYKHTFNLMLFIRSLVLPTLIFILYSQLHTTTKESSSGEEQTLLSVSFLQGISFILEYSFNTFGTKFYLKFIQHVYTLVLIISTCVYINNNNQQSNGQLKAEFNQLTLGQHSSLASIFLLVPYFILLIYLEYNSERVQRLLFINERHCKELQFLIDKIMPINIVQTKFNMKEQRVILHNANRKAANNLKILDDESLKTFCKNVYLKPKLNNKQETSENNNNKSFCQSIKGGQQTTLFCYLEELANQYKQTNASDNTLKPSNLKKFNQQTIQLNSVIIRKKTNTTFQFSDKPQLQCDEIQSTKVLSPSKRNLTLMLKQNLRKLSNLNLKDYISQSVYSSNYIQRLRVCQAEYQSDDFEMKRLFNIKIFVFMTHELFIYVIIEDTTLQQQIDYQSQFIKLQKNVFNQFYDELRQSMTYCLHYINQIQQQNVQLQSQHAKAQQQFQQQKGKYSVNDSLRNKMKINQLKLQQNLNIPKTASDLQSFNNSQISLTDSPHISSRIVTASEERSPYLQNYHLLPISKLRCMDNYMRQFKFLGYQSLNLIYNYIDYQNICKNIFGLQITSIKLSKLMMDVREVIQSELDRKNVVFNVINELVIFNNSQKPLNSQEEQKNIIIEMESEQQKEQQQQQQQQPQAQCSDNGSVERDRSSCRGGAGDAAVMGGENDDTIVTDERRLKMAILNILFTSLQYINQAGYIILRITQSNKLSNTLTFQFIDSSEKQIELDNETGKNIEFKINSVQDMKNIQDYGNLYFLLQMSRKIIGKIGPYQDIQCVPQSQNGSNLKFKIYRDFNKLDQAIKSLQKYQTESLKKQNLNFEVQHSEDLNDESDQEIHQVAFKLKVSDSEYFQQKQINLSSFNQCENINIESYQCKSDTSNDQVSNFEFVNPKLKPDYQEQISITDICNINTQQADDIK